eukprot:scaffold14932_cov133-Isochrysis_galbana.AAC.6
MEKTADATLRRHAFHSRALESSIVLVDRLCALSCALLLRASTLDASLAVHSYSSLAPVGLGAFWSYDDGSPGARLCM